MVGIRLLTLIPTLRYSNPPSCLPSRIEESFFSVNFHLDLFFFVIRIERRDGKDRSKNIGRRRQFLDLLTLQVSREFRKIRRVILMANDNPVRPRGGRIPKGRIPNDSLYARPDCYSNAPESTGFTELGNFARRKRSGWAMIEGRERKKRGWKGGENELQKIVLVKYDDLHLSRYKEILWPSNSRGFLPLWLELFLTHDQRSIRSRVRIFRRGDFFFIILWLFVLFFSFFLPSFLSLSLFF